MASISTSCKIDIGKLEGKENWITWRYKVTQLLRSCKGGLDAIQGKLKKPIHPGPMASPEQLSEYEKAFENYEAVDSNAVLLLTANMSEETLQKIMRLETSKEIWDELHRLFGGPTVDRTYTACLDFFHYCKDSSHDIATHISTIKNLWHELQLELKREFNCDLPEVLLICKILDTLPEEFFSFKSSWLLMSKADRNIDNLTDQVCSHEKSLNGKPEEVKTEALTVQNNKPNKKKCGYCGKVGHNVRQCRKWIADGKPPKPTSQQDNPVTSLLSLNNQVAIHLMNGDADS